MNSTVLETRSLTKSYDGRSTAVRRLDLTINRGEIYGFLGRNGAGKTTTLRMISGLLEPTEGSIEVFGEPLTIETTKHYGRLGIVLDHSGLYPQLSARENLLLHARLMGLKGDVDGALLGAGFEIADGKKAKTFSAGEARRLILARTLLHSPDFLILDEPTIGLDPQGTRELRRTLKKLVEAQGVTVLISSHILSEVQHLATRIGILHRGELLQEIDMDGWRRENRTALRLKVDDGRKTAVILEEKFGMRDFILEEGDVLKIYEKTEEAAAINRSLNQEGIMVSELAVNGDDLESLFIALTRGDGNA